MLQESKFRAFKFETQTLNYKVFPDYRDGLL